MHACRRGSWLGGIPSQQGRAGVGRELRRPSVRPGPRPDPTAIQLTNNHLAARFFSCPSQALPCLLGDQRAGRRGAAPREAATLDACPLPPAVSNPLFPPTARLEPHDTTTAHAATHAHASIHPSSSSSCPAACRPVWSAVTSHRQLLHAPLYISSCPASLRPSLPPTPVSSARLG